MAHYAQWLGCQLTRRSLDFTVGPMRVTIGDLPFRKGQRQEDPNKVPEWASNKASWAHTMEAR
jgi:hypothetical protein